MQLKEYFPTRLGGMVEKIWEQENTSSSTWKILPSGKVELIFRLGSPSTELKDSKKINRQDNPMDHFCFLSGLHTKPLVMTFSRFHYLGVQMKPIAVKALFRMPVCEIRDYYIEGSHIFQTLHEIEDRLNELDTFTKKAQWLESHLYKLIHETPDMHQAIKLQKVSTQFLRNRDNLRHQSIEDLLGYSRTQTFRIFNDWFGVSAYSYQKLMQFVQTIHGMHRSPDNLTITGLKNGYFDQSHFIRSFKEFADMTPGAYKKNMTPILGQFPVLRP